MRLGKRSNDRQVVAHVRDTYFKLSENWIHGLVSNLQDWRPIVLARITQNLDQVNNIPDYFARWEDMHGIVRRFDDQAERLLKLYPSEYLVSKWKGVSLVHAHFGFTGYKYLPLAKALEVPLVTTFYGYDVSQLPKQDPEWLSRYNRLFEYASAVIAEGPHMQKQLIKLGCPEEKIHVQRIGINVENYPFQPRVKKREEPLRILMAGRFKEKKGFVDAVKAFAHLYSMGVQARLTIVGDSYGSGPSQLIKEKIVSIVERKSLSSFVDFKGFLPVQELRDAYYDYHVFLSPSTEAKSGDNEGGAPIAMVEAQSTGLPVVSTWHCDIPNVVQDGETGLLSSEGDVTSLSRSLQKLANNPRELIRMGKKAHQRMVDNHNVSEVGKQIGKLYNSITENR